MTSLRTDLAAFAAGLSARLPGTWTSQYQRHSQYADQFPRTEQLWDTGHVDYVVSQYVLTHDAVLHGPVDQRLYVTDRPRYPHPASAPARPPKAAPSRLIGYTCARTDASGPPVPSWSDRA